MSVSQTTTTGKSSFNVGAISAVLTVSGFFCMLNETVLNMALKSIMGQFGTSAITAQWLSTGYMLIMLMMMSQTQQSRQPRLMIGADMLIYFQYQSSLHNA